MSQNETPNKPRKPRKFRNTVFLFRMLASVFAVQISIILFSFKSCYDFTIEKNAVVSEVCPHLTDKFESTTTTMIATVLSLMVGKEIRDK